MAAFSTPPCPDNWEPCSFCGAGPEEECRNPDYQQKGKRMAIEADLVVAHNTRRIKPCPANPYEMCDTPSRCREYGCGKTGEKLKLATPLTAESAAHHLADKIIAENTSAIKETNPKDAAGAPKVSVSLVPEIAIIELSQAFRDGAEKYTPFNWRRAPVKMSVYIDAMERHLMLLRAGQDLASDSELHHATHIMSGCAILLDAALNGTLIDDRHKLPDPKKLEKTLDEYRDRNDPKSKPSAYGD